MTATTFAERGSLQDVETGTSLAPKFDAHGLIMAIAADAATGDVLMVAHMNEAALARTIATREAWFWSRSRKELWRKGITAATRSRSSRFGSTATRTRSCSRCAIAGDEVACHQGYRSCFYRSVPLGSEPSPETRLSFDDAMKRVPPKGVKR